MEDATLPKGKNLVHFLLLPPKGTDVRQLTEGLHVTCLALITLVNVACVTIITLVNVVLVAVINLVLNVA